MLAKIRRSIEQFGLVEHLVARPHPTEHGCYEVISGNHRLQLLAEMGFDTAPVVVIEVDDARARLLAQTLNRTRGSDDPIAYAELLNDVLTQMGAEEGTKAALALLPETESSLEWALQSLAAEQPDTVPRLPAERVSRRGCVYELGSHRLMCGDATSVADVAKLMAGERAGLLLADPPYGTRTSHAWRDSVRRPFGTTRVGIVANDDRADWREAWALTDAPIAYVWHSGLHAAEVQASLEASGYGIRSQLIWVKAYTFGRSHYAWRHEPIFYCVRKGASANWRGGNRQTTIFEEPSPIMPWGNRGADERTTHPTQKPKAIHARWIRNHLDKGQIVYDPFGGSGTTLVAADEAGRRCFAMEIDPVYCDVIRARYEQLKR